MVEWREVKTKTLTKISLVAALTLLVVSIAAIIFHAELIDYYSYLLLSPTPLGALYYTLIVAYTGQINTVIDVVAFMNPRVKLLLDLLYLLPTLGAFLLSFIAVLCKNLSELSGCETFQDVIDSVSFVSEEREKGELLINFNLVYILVFLHFLIYYALPVVNHLLIVISFLFLILTEWTGYNIATSLSRVIEKEKEMI